MLIGRPDQIYTGLLFLCMAEVPPCRNQDAGGSTSFDVPDVKVFDAGARTGEDAQRHKVRNRVCPYALLISININASKKVILVEG